MARPRFQPTDEQRRTVKTMAAFGTPQEEIARTVRIAAKTLRVHFRDELDNAATAANLQVTNTMYKMAISGKVPAATMFWLKARCGWRERDSLPMLEAFPPQFNIRVEPSNS